MRQLKNILQWNMLIFISTTAFFAMSLMFSSAQAETPNLSGHIVLRKGQTIDFIKLDHDHYKYVNFKYGNQNKETTIHLSKVKTITFGEESESALIVLKNGRKIKAHPEGDYHGHPEWNPDDHRLLYYYFDDVAQKERRDALSYDNIAKIVIGKKAGKLRQCPHCSSIWPDNYLFCPHDGEKTVWAK